MLHPKPLPEPLLRRAAACLRPPGATGVVAPLPDGTGWQDPESGRAFRVRDGVLDLLGGEFALTRP